MLVTDNVESKEVYSEVMSLIPLFQQGMFIRYVFIVDGNYKLQDFQTRDQKIYVN